MFFCEFCEIFQDTYFVDYLPTAASKIKDTKYFLQRKYSYHI